MTATEPLGGSDDLTLRQAGIDDLPAVARIHLAARAHAESEGWFPPGVHPPEEADAWVRGWDLAEQ